MPQSILPESTVMKQAGRSAPPRGLRRGARGRLIRFGAVFGGLLLVCTATAATSMAVVPGAEFWNAEPWNADPWNAEPWNAEPWNAEPWNAEPWNAEPSNIEPSNIEPSNIEPSNPEQPVYRGESVVAGRSSTGGPSGWATQGGGTTGGGGIATADASDASPVTVSSESELKDAISGDSATVVRVSGKISCSGMLRVGSNKSILGEQGGTISGCGFNVSKAENVIIQDITFQDASDDSINVEHSSRVWIDHNSFTRCSDGCVDIKRAADYVTVSWNHAFDSHKLMLLGHSDDNASEDAGHLRVTYHHNWFDGSGTRHPRVRFGNPVHVFNNFFSNNEYGVASTMNACVMVEANYFEKVKEPTLVGYAASGDGDLVLRDNEFVDSGDPESAGDCQSIPYSYSPESASDVKSSVTSGAGPRS